jgi:hypothetical protein
MAKHWLQNLFQCAASAENAGFHGAYTAFQNFGDFFVTEAFQIAKNYGTAKNMRYFLQRRLHRLLNFVRGELIKRSSAFIFDLDSVMAFFGFGIDRDIFLKVALEPTLMIQGFADGDAIEPRFQGAALAETADAAKRL